MPKAKAHKPKNIHLLELGSGPKGGIAYRIAKFRSSKKLPKRRIVATDLESIDVSKVADFEGRGRIDFKNLLQELINKGVKVKFLKADFLLNNIEPHEAMFFMETCRRLLQKDGKILINGGFKQTDAARQLFQLRGFKVKSFKILNAFKMTPKLKKLFESDPSTVDKLLNSAKAGFNYAEVVNWAKKNNLFQNFSEQAQYQLISTALIRWYDQKTTERNPRKYPAELDVVQMTVTSE